MTTEDTKLTRTKQRWAAEGRFLTGHTALPRSDRPETDRLPPGQHLTTDFPVLDLGIQPAIDPAGWTLRLHGSLANQVTLDWDAFRALPQRTITNDIHCVTTWSRYANTWQGVATLDLLALVEPLAEARFAILHGADGYATNVPLADFAAPDALLATHWNDEPLSTAHGFPVRAVVPHLYFWKSAKWITRIELSPADKPGYWEQNGYHMRGDPWTEQRYG